MMRPMHATGRPALQDLLACPQCHGGLDRTPGAYVCVACGRSYPIETGIPIFAHGLAIEHDELDHLTGHDKHASTGHGHGPAGSSHKAAQAGYFDRATQVEFEIERPRTAPALYQFLMTEKFRRAVGPIDGGLQNLTALTVCGGSGMDAEFLARAGASVISSDISAGAAGRALERARRHDLAVASIVADVERLPFGDRSVDLVFVHDGLHHLADPMAGLDEMMRVTRRWLSISEPSRAALTNLAVRLGVAQDREESGNVVARLDRASVNRHLEAAGFTVVGSRRYAMFYRHHPGRFFQLLSRPPLLGLVTAGWRIVNRLVGPAGNKLTIVAVRRDV